MAKREVRVIEENLNGRGWTASDVTLNDFADGYVAYLAEGDEVNCINCGHAFERHSAPLIAGSAFACSDCECLALRVMPAPAPETVELFVVQKQEGDKWRTVQSPYEHDNRRELFDSVTAAESVADWWGKSARIVRLVGSVVTES